VAGWIKANHLQQDEAAEILNVTRPRVSDIVNGKLSKFSVDALINMVIRTGKTVQVIAR
jgi:predicted XRE-type DNA-binding protein